MYYLIQGFFYQHQEWIGTAYKGSEGLAAVMNQGVLPFMYAGAIWNEGHDEINALIGEMTDNFGQSTLRDIEISETELSFSKYYEKYEILGTNRHIRYVFHRGDQNTWLGTYEFRDGPSMEGGTTRCILTPIDFALVQRDLTKAAEYVPDQLDLGLPRSAKPSDFGSERPGASSFRSTRVRVDAEPEDDIPF